MASKRLLDFVRLYQPGHSHPIGTIARRHQVTATVSYLDSSGEVVFGDEAPIEVEFAWKELPPARNGSSDCRVWVGFEVQTRDTRLKDCAAVIATHPYSTDWFDWADFKRTLNRGREEREAHLGEPQSAIRPTAARQAKRPGRSTQERSASPLR